MLRFTQLSGIQATPIVNIDQTGEWYGLLVGSSLVHQGGFLAAGVIFQCCWCSK